MKKRMSKNRRLAVSRNATADRPAMMKMNTNSCPDGCYLFDDGTFGRITAEDFDPESWFEDGYDEDDLLLDGKEPIGQMYIDRWTRDGDSIEGGCYLYYKETLADYCRRNGEPLPMRSIPEDVIYAFESGDQDALRMLESEVPELKGISF